MAGYEWLGPAADEPPYHPSYQELQLIDHFKVAWLSLLDQPTTPDRPQKVMDLRENAVLFMMGVDHLPIRVCEHILKTAELEAQHAL